MLCIKNYIKEKEYNNEVLVPNWKLKSVYNIIHLIKTENVSRVIIEYAGNGYKRDLAISFLPIFLRVINLFSKKRIRCHLRVHDYTMC